MMPENIDSFSGLTLNCNGTNTQLSECDGRATIVAEQGYSRSQIDAQCEKDPGSSCFAKVFASLPLIVKHEILIAMFFRDLR